MAHITFFMAAVSFLLSKLSRVDFDFAVVNNKTRKRLIPKMLKVQISPGESQTHKSYTT